jgi:hypothetical protein
VDGLAPHIERCHAGGRQYNGLFAAAAPKQLQQRGLARACPPGDEQVQALFFNSVQSILKIGVEFERLFVQHLTSP